MLIDLSQAIGSYLHDVFVAKFQWWVLLGYVAQIMFTMRFLVQWIASERAGKMVMPIAFWFFSIGGGLLLFSYALYIRDPVFILGQGFGVFVYARNLYFELRDRGGAKAAVSAARPPSGGIDRAPVNRVFTAPLQGRQSRIRGRGSGRRHPRARCAGAPSARPASISSPCGCWCSRMERPSSRSRPTTRQCRTDRAR